MQTNDMTSQDTTMLCIGQKEICKFLQVKNWSTVRRFVRHYGLPVIHKNGQPVLRIEQGIHFLESRDETWGKRLWEKKFDSREETGTHATG